MFTLKDLSLTEKKFFYFGVALVLLRFVAIRIVPYLIDEPLFQVWAQEMIHEGKIRLVAMGGSSLPVSYGGGAIWLYSIPNLITTHPLGFVLFHTILYSTGFFSLFFALKKFFGVKPALYSFLLASSSPFLFFFSRHPWDTTFFMPITSACLLLLSALSDKKYKDAFLGKNGIIWPFSFLALLLALAINIQLSCGPFVLLVGLASLFLWWREKEKSKTFFLGIVYMVALVILLITPYLLEAWHVHLTNPPLVHKKINEHWGTGRHFWWNILYSMTWLSTWQGRIFFEPVASDFNAMAGAFLSSVFKLDIFGWCLKLGSLMGIFLPLFFLIKKKSLPFFNWVALLGFFIVMLVFQYINIPMQPHYFQSFWWLHFAGLAGFLFVCKFSNHIVAKTLVAGAVITNIAFVAVSLGFLLKNEGTRGLHHGTGILEVRRAVEEFCVQAKQRSKQTIQLDVAPVFTPDNAIKYFFDRNPQCSGLTLSIARLSWPNSDARLVYDNSTNTSARLQTEWH